MTCLQWKVGESSVFYDRACLKLICLALSLKSLILGDVFLCTPFTHYADFFFSHVNCLYSVHRCLATIAAAIASLPSIFMIVCHMVNPSQKPSVEYCAVLFCVSYWYNFFNSIRYDSVSYKQLFTLGLETSNNDIEDTFLWFCYYVFCMSSKNFSVNPEFIHFVARLAE